MAIQQINLGTAPSGAGGDTQRAANEKINQNFSNSTHAASRLVGTASGNVMEVGALGLGSTVNIVLKGTDITTYEFKTGFYACQTPTNPPKPNLSDDDWWFIDSRVFMQGQYEILYATHIRDLGQTYVGTRYANAWRGWDRILSHGNTTRDAGTGFIKTSSPVLHVYNDSITKIHEAEQLDIVVDKKGVGHYEIHGTTGLRKNDGWNMSPPRDIHGNVRCMIDVTEKDNIITLKTYKRKFDLELAAIVHDYDNPMDIPEGACVEFRFNDLPQEQLDEPIE